MNRSGTLGFLAGTALMLAACGSGEEAPSSPAEPETSTGTSENTVQEQGDTRAPSAPAQTGDEAFADLPAPYNEASYATGRRTFKLCSSCHTIAEGAPNLVGPNLHGIFDRQVGEADGFSYSAALQEADFEWTPERLEEWLENPRTFLPGNNMSFAGVRRPADRHAVIAYIMVESGYSAD